MTEHRIKVAAPYMDALLDGRKTFEVRRNDRAYQAGDTLRLLEVDPDKCSASCTDRSCSRPKNRVAEASVTYVYAGDPRFGGHGGMQPGYVVLGLAGPIPAVATYLDRP